jgi:RNA polymerase sigma-70 factor (ECF subfamily)
MTEKSDVTRILERISRGDEEAVDLLVPLVYDELRGLARRYLARELPGHTLQPTALVHEAFLRLAGASEIPWQDRAHFVGVAARAMRQVLVSHAVRRKAAKRGGGWTRIPLDDAVALFESPSIDIVALDRALEELSAVDPRQCRVVELRFFGGLTVAEVAKVLRVSPRTVEREWTFARAWLRRKITVNGREGT